MNVRKVHKDHQAIVITKANTPQQYKPNGQALGKAIRYKGFIIEPQLVSVCTEAGGNEFIIEGQRLAYRIYHSATKLIYGMKSTLSLAQYTIDKNEVRWLRTEL